MKSMTGFGNASLDNELMKLAVEIKTVNGRFLEIKQIIPNELSTIEFEIEKEIKKVIKRGRVEIKIRYEDKREQNIIININKFKAYIKVYEQAKELIKSKEEIYLPYLLKEKDIMYLEENKIEELKNYIVETIKKALNKQQEMAIKEGIAMYKFLKDSFQKCIKAINIIKKYVPEHRKELEKKLISNVNDILNAKLNDENMKRLMMEVAFYVDKYDINEEIIRLEEHYNRFEKKLDEKEVVIGKTLNFILQEMHREINTISSKFIYSKAFEHILEIKEEIEKCREIVQNIE